MNKVIIISGPTATGKTKTSIDLAISIEKNFNRKTAIVNFDSLLFYKEISIGTAKPTIEERSGIDHYMIDIESICSPMNAADFIKKGEDIISSLLNQGIIPILVGGSAFYLRALLKGMYESVTASPEIKRKLEVLFEKHGIDPFVEFLKKNDPKSLIHLHVNDHYRIIRAVEHFEMTGQKISLQKERHDNENPYDFSKISKPWTVLNLYLDLPKDLHYEYIKKRTHEMFSNGLLEEISHLKLLYPDLSQKPLSSIGYKEAISYLRGEFNSLEDCIERISISTRQLAKSQRTFFNKITPKECYNPLIDQDRIKETVNRFIRG
jgi:tRNA dimethylallyltransferase